MQAEKPAFPTAMGPSDESFTVVECGAAEAAWWDEFVTRCKGTYCHLYEWKSILERSYGLNTRYLAFRSGSAWAGVLPLALMPHLPGRPAQAISLPYCNYGGLLAAPAADAAALRTMAAEYLLTRGVRTIEFRDRTEDSAASNEVSMVRQLPQRAEALWEELGVKVRNQVRKAQRSDLTICWGREQAAHLYDIYAIKMGELGTPVHSKRFIDEILANLGERTDILTVRHHGRPVAAMLLIKFADAWSDPFAASLSQFKAMNPNMLLYWEALKAACEAGAREFDFGRSHRASGTYNFKKQWGAREIGLNYYTYRGGVLAHAAATDFYRSHTASWLSRTWRNLPAVWQRRLGPLVRRWVP